MPSYLTHHLLLQVPFVRLSITAGLPPVPFVQPAMPAPWSSSAIRTAVTPLLSAIRTAWRRFRPCFPPPPLDFWGLPPCLCPLKRHLSTGLAVRMALEQYESHSRLCVWHIPVRKPLDHCARGTGQLYTWHSTPAQMPKMQFQVLVFKGVFSLPTFCSTSSTSSTLCRPGGLFPNPPVEDSRSPDRTRDLSRFLACNAGGASRWHFPERNNYALKV